MNEISLSFRGSVHGEVAKKEFLHAVASSSFVSPKGLEYTWQVS